jgi:hypothetical protein
MPESHLSVNADQRRAVAAYLRVADFIDVELADLNPKSEDHARLTTVAAAFRGRAPARPA